MQEVGAHPVAVVEQDRPAREVQVIGKGDHARGRRLHRGAVRRGDVHARVGRAGGAVVDALVAEAAADATLDRADEMLGEPGAGIVAGARGADRRLLACDACGDRRWWLHGLAGNTVDAFDRPVAWSDLDFNGARPSVTAGYLHVHRPRLVARHAEGDAAVAGHAQVAPGM